MIIYKYLQTKFTSISILREHIYSTVQNNYLGVREQGRNSFLLRTFSSRNWVPVSLWNKTIFRIKKLTLVNLWQSF